MMSFRGNIELLKGLLAVKLIKNLNSLTLKLAVDDSILVMIRASKYFSVLIATKITPNPVIITITRAQTTFKAIEFTLCK